MTFSRGTPHAKISQISQCLSVQVVEKHERYLGMPAVVGEVETTDFWHHSGPYLEAHQWLGRKDSSRVGNEVLIKAVLRSIPTYMMSCFMLMGYLINSIEAAIRKFWWESGTDHKMVWVSWAIFANRSVLGAWAFVICIALILTYTC